MKNLIILLICLLLVSALSADDGGTRSPFSLGAGSRDMALGGSSASTCHPATAMYWNGSRLATAEQYTFTAFGTRLYESDVNYQYFGLAIPTLDYGSFGLGVFHLGISGIERRDDGNLLIEEFSDSRTAIYLSYARHFSDFAIGVTFVMEHHSLADYSASSSPGINLSMSRRFAFQEKKVSYIDTYFNGRNMIQPSYKLVDETAKYPMGIEAGVTVGFSISKKYQQTAAVSLKMEKFDNVDARLSAGIEYSIAEMLRLRGGINHGNPSTGLGVEYRGLSFDYAFVGRDLGSLHMFTLSSMFGSTVSSRRESRIQARESEFQLLMVDRMKSRNDDLIRQMIDYGNEMLSAGDIVEAKNSFDRALFLVQNSGQKNPELSQKVQDTNERLEQAMNLKRYNLYMDSASAQFDAQQYLSAKYFAGMALNEVANSTDARKVIEAAEQALSMKYSQEERIQRELLIADSLLSYGKIQESLTILAELRRLDPDNPNIHMSVKKAFFEQWKARAQSFYSVGEFNSARTAVDSARSYFPGHKWCQLEYGRIEKALVRTQKPVVTNIVQPIVRLTPELEKEVLSLYNDGQKKFRKGQLAEAIAHWEQVETLVPDYQSVREYLVNAYKFMGVDLYGQNKLSDAVTIWQKAAGLAPENTEIIDYINRTESEIKKLQELSYDAR